jgi:hypothetical protein
MNARSRSEDGKDASRPREPTLRGASGPEHELERVVHERRAELEQYAAQFEETAVELGRREERLRDERASVERLLRRSTAELEAREKELVEFERELQTRDERISAAESELARRRSEVGAVELQRAAVERREQALEAREATVASREAQSDAPAQESKPPVELLFVPGAAYRLVEVEARVLEPGATAEVDGEEYGVTRIARSPLPGDARRCAYLVRGVRERDSGGSS